MQKYDVELTLTGIEAKDSDEAFAKVMESVYPTISASGGDVTITEVYETGENEEGELDLCLGCEQEAGLCECILSEDTPEGYHDNLENYSDEVPDYDRDETV